MNLHVRVHGSPDRQGHVHVVRHVEGLDAAAGAGRRGMADDGGPLPDCHVPGEKLAGAVATGVDQHGHLAPIAQIFRRKDELVLGVGVKEEVLRVLVIVAAVAQHVRLVVEVGRHLLRQPAAAAAVAAHVDDEAGNGMVVEFPDHPFPEVYRQALVVAEGVNVDEAVFGLLDFLELQRQVMSAAAGKERGKVEAVAFVADGQGRRGFLFIARIDPADFHLAVGRETRGIAQLLQPLLLLQAEGLGPRHGIPHVVVNRQAVNLENLGAVFDAGFGGRAVVEQEVDHNAAIVEIADGNADAAGGRFAEGAVHGRAETHAHVSVRDRPGEIAQGQFIGGGISGSLGFCEARPKRLAFGVPVDALVLAKGVFQTELVQHGVEGFRVGKLREIVDFGGLALDEVDDRLRRAVEGEGVVVQVHEGVAGREAHRRIILREQETVLAVAGGETLLVVRGVDQQLAANDFVQGFGAVAGVRRGIGVGPAAAIEVAFLQFRRPPGVGPVGDGENLDAGVFLAVVVHVAQAATGLEGQLQRPGNGRGEEVAGQAAENLRLRRKNEVPVAIYKAGLVLQDDERLGDAIRKVGIGIGHFARQHARATLVIDDLRRRQFRLGADGKRHSQQQAGDDRWFQHGTTPFSIKASDHTTIPANACQCLNTILADG